MNSHIVEKTMHSIKNIDRLTDLAAIDVYNTTHDTINKYEIMKEHATEEYTNESFYQESVLAGVLIGAGVLGVAVSAFFIIKKIIDSKDSADSSVKSADGKMVAAQVDLSDPKSTEKYLTDLKARLEKLTETKSIKVTKSINKDEFEAAEKQINDWSEKLQEIIDNKHEAAEIEKIIDGMDISSVDVSKIFVNNEVDASVADFAEALGLRSISSFASLLSSLKKKIDDVEKMVNNKKDKEAENAVQISQDHLTKLKNQNNAAAKLIAALKSQSKETLSETDKAVLGAINAETEAKNKTEEPKPTTGTGSDTPKNTKPQEQSDETATPVAQNSGQNIPPSSTPENLNFQASGFNGGQSAEPASQPAPAANPQASATSSETPTPVSGNQSVEPNLGTNFLNAVNSQRQQRQNENLTQQFGSNTAKENSNTENWINAANANNAAAEAEKKPEDQVKTEPEIPPTPTDQTSSDDEKITKLANELYHTPTDDNKRQILGDLNRLREGESSVITHLNDVKTSLLEQIKNGQDSSMSQAILDKIVSDYKAIAKEFGINADYLKNYAATIPTEAPNDNAVQVTYSDDGKITINGKNTGVLKSWSDDMNERAKQIISYYIDQTDFTKKAIANNVSAIFGQDKSGDLKTALNKMYQTGVNSVKNRIRSPEDVETTLQTWYNRFVDIAKYLGEDENFPPVPDFKANGAQNDNDADKSKSENENKEKSKPTASDFENFKNPEANPESQQRFNSEINNADKSSAQSVQSDEAALRQQAALKQQADAKEASAKEINKYQSNINGTLSSDSEENKAAQWIANAQSHDQEGDSGSNLGTNFLNAVRNDKAKMNEQPSTEASDSSEQKSEPSTTEEPKTSEAPAAPETSGRLIPSALTQDEVEAIRNSVVHEFSIRNYPSTFAEQLADIIIDKYDGDVVKYAIDGYNNAKGKNARQIKTNKGKIYNRAIILANIFNIPEDEIPKPDEKIETTNTEQQNSSTDVETNQEKTPEWQKISDEASHNTNGSMYNSGLPVTLNEPDTVDIDSIAADIKNGKSEVAIMKSLIDKGYSQADAIRYINMAEEDIDEEQSKPVQSDEERAAQWIANAKANGGSQNTQPTVQSVQDQNEETTPTLGTNFLNAVRNGKAKMDEQPTQPQLAQPQPEVSQDTTNPGPDDEERAAQWIANAKANEVPETPATPAVDSANNEFNYGANWLSSMQQAQKENEINNNINYLRDEGYNNDQIRDLLAKQGYDRNDVNTVLNMSDDQLKAIQDAINNNNVSTITSQDHDAVPAPPQLPKKLPLEPETHIDLDAAAPVNEVPAGVNQVNINDAEEAAKNNYLNTKIAKNPKLGYPSLEALNNAVDELIAMIKQNVAIGNDPSQYAVGALHNIYNIASAKNKLALPFDKLAALKAVKQYIKYRMIKQGVGNYFAEMTENDIGYYSLIQEYKIEIIREEKLKMIQEQQG